MTAFLLLLTGSRGGLVAVATWILILSTVKRRGRLFRILVIGLFVFSIIYIIAPLVLPSSVYLRLFTSDSYMSTIASEKNRVAIWTYCFEALVPRMKMWGYGAGVPPYMIGSYFGYLLRRGIHNTFLSMFLEFGYLGLPAFVMLLFLLIRRCISTKNREALALMVGIIIIAFFLESYPRTYFWNILTYCSVYTKMQASNDYTDKQSKLCI